jgi:hypothetical protein
MNLSVLKAGNDADRSPVNNSLVPGPKFKKKVILFSCVHGYMITRANKDEVVTYRVMKISFTILQRKNTKNIWVTHFAWAIMSALVPDNRDHRISFINL